MPEKISLNRTNMKKKVRTSRLPQPLPISTKNYISFYPSPRKLTKRKYSPDEKGFCECFNRDGE